ncbi:MAG: hypothetical protein ACLP5V_15785 [Candidatus Bathyarchaeia archaeon]
MVQICAKTRNYAILGIVLILAIIAVGVNSNPVLAQAQPCTAVLSYPVIPATYPYSNVPITVPMSATCTTVYGNQLYATGNAYDATSNVALGTVNSVLQSSDGGTTFNGQLEFNLPPATQGHTVTISVSLYSNQYNDLVTSTSETFQAVTGSQQVQQVVTTTVTQAYQYPYQPPVSTPYSYPTPYTNQTSDPPQAPSVQQPLQQQPYGHQSQYQTLYYHNSLLDYVAIAAILAAVVIATAGLVVYGQRRRQPRSIGWVPAFPPPPPPR